MRATTDPSRTAIISLAALGALSLSACGSDRGRGSGSVDPSSAARLPQADEPVDLDPADFTVDVELKFYAPGIGPVLALDISGGAVREELVETSRAG